MTMGEQGQLDCMQIITFAGNARSLYIRAIHAAHAGKKDEAQALIDEARESYNRAHDIHLSLFGAEEEGTMALNLLVVHAEDQLMSAEEFGILAEEFAME
jgi:PTS system cellobiose-specific IIA component